MAVENRCAAFTLPMGSVSRMLRATATGSPCYMTSVGSNTFVDPALGGGAVNDAARAYVAEHGALVKEIAYEGRRYLAYKALPVDIAFIRATTSDLAGNLTCEHESLLLDIRIVKKKYLYIKSTPFHQLQSFSAHVVLYVDGDGGAQLGRLGCGASGARRADVVARRAQSEGPRRACRLRLPRAARITT
jgi:hypothetical protein